VFFVHAVHAKTVAYLIKYFISLGGGYGSGDELNSIKNYILLHRFAVQIVLSTNYDLFVNKTSYFN
jgi:hypothetical protein